jgi:lycopene cyclase domain-containing protein
MSYTALGLVAIVVAVVADLWVFRTRLLTRTAFWVSYAIIVFFQLLTNGVLTGFRIVRYDGDVIIGSTTPSDGPPPMFGDGRALYAPVEDLMFGFGLVVLTLVLWVWWGRRGVQRLPYSGPPIRGFPGARRLPDEGSVTPGLADPAGPEAPPVDPGLPPGR